LGVVRTSKVGASGPALGVQRRVSTAHLRRPQRIEFHLLVVVTRGRCTHWVDFVANDCRARSWIIVRPGQVQRFDPTTHWDGWIVLFQPEFILLRGSSSLRAELAATPASMRCRIT
jgi:AraC-like ligand binding domain